VCFKLFFGGAVITLPHVVWTIQTMDAGTITALLGSTLGAYVIRRYTDAKFIDSNSNGVDDRQETTTTSTGGQTVTKTTS
jgi:hypothetical protein